MKKAGSLAGLFHCPLQRFIHDGDIRWDDEHLDVVFSRQGFYPFDRLALSEQHDRDSAHGGTAEELVGTIFRVFAIQQAYSRPHTADCLIRCLGRAREAHGIAERLDESSEQRGSNRVG